MSLQKNLTRLYSGLVFDRPWLTLSVLILIAASFGYYAQFFRLDASADSLLLEGDAELEYSRQVNVRYGLRESVIVAYTPLEGELFSRPVLSRLQALRADLLTLPRVESVDSILNVPIFEDTPLTGISEDYLTLEQEIDLAAAKAELMSSPVFSNAVVSPDGETAGMLVSFELDLKAQALLARRSELREAGALGVLDADDLAELRAVEQEYSAYTVMTGARQSATIAPPEFFLAALLYSCFFLPRLSNPVKPAVSPSIVWCLPRPLHRAGFPQLACPPQPPGLPFVPPPKHHPLPHRFPSARLPHWHVFPLL